MPLLGLFCCNPDPYHSHFDPDADAGYFDVIWIQIWIFDPDAVFDQDGPRYTELTVMYYYWALFALKWHYLGYFDVIRIQIWICEPDADFDQDGPIYTELHYWP